VPGGVCGSFIQPASSKQAASACSIIFITNVLYEGGELGLNPGLIKVKEKRQTAPVLV
jgi:hypothetical protein